VVFEGRAVSVAAETAFPGGVSRTCRGDVSEPASVDKGCVVARVVRDGCKPVGKLKISLRGGSGSSRREAETAADGFARGCGLSDGAYHLEAPGAVPVTLTLAAGSPAGAFARVQIPAAARITVQTEFHVTKVLRGSPVKAAIVHVDDADCRFDFRVGEQYRVFASKGKDGRLTTNGCSPTKELRGNKWTCGTEEWIKRGRIRHPGEHRSNRLQKCEAKPRPLAFVPERGFVRVQLRFRPDDQFGHRGRFSRRRSRPARTSSQSRASPGAARWAASRSSRSCWCHSWRGAWSASAATRSHSDCT
jgi:hypothetical protein